MLLCGCHPILDSARVSVHDLQPKGRVQDLVIQKLPEEGPAQSASAISYCTSLRDDARSYARQKETWGFIVGGIGVLGGGTAAGIAAASSDTGTKEWAAVGVAGGALLTGVAAYLLASASTDRTGDGVLSSALIQMGSVDPYFVTLPSAPTIDTTSTTTQTASYSSVAATTSQTVTTDTTTTKKSDNVSNELKVTTTGGVVQGQPAATGAPIQDEGVKREIKTVTVNHQIVVEPVIREIAERVQWQTCAKAITTWQAGAGAALNSAAGAIGK